MRNYIKNKRKQVTLKDKNFKNLELIYLEWEDAISDSGSGWRDISSAKQWVENCNWLVRQAGFLVYEDKKFIVLAGSDKNSDIYGPRKLNLLFKIPTTWVRKRIDLTKYVQKMEDKNFA